MKAATIVARSSQGTLASSPLRDDGEDKGSVSAEDKDALEQARQAEEGEPIEKIKINHRWTIYDPFDFGPPPPPPKTMDDAETIRLASANFLSKFTFWWIRPLLVLGYKRELQATDLPKMDPTRESGYLADKFEINFEKRRKAVEDWNRALDDGTYQPTALVRARWRLNEMLGFGRRGGRRNVGLALALSDTFFWEFWSAGIFKVLADAAQVTSPLVMRQIIRQTQKAWAAKQAAQPLPPVNPAVGAAIGLFLMQIWVSYFQANTFARSGQVGVQARAALIASLYRKAFRMNGKARTTLTNAKLTSHISTSISRIDWASTFFHFSWTTLIQLAEVIIILLCTIGVSSLAGIALVLVALPMQTYAMRQLFKGRQQAQVFTDERIKSISELLSGIRIVKFFAWEKPILDKVATSRKRELGKVRKLLAIRAANQAIAMSIPLLASVLVFAVYSLTGHSQNPAEIWTSLALLNLLRAPLMMLPNSLSTMTDALSALTNLVPVFVAEELPEKLFEIDEKAELALEVRDATFEWETSPPPASGAKGRKPKSGKKASKVVAAEKTEKDESPSRLEDINLRVPRGQLLCIVGSVGSGKSSLLQGCIGEMRRVKGEVVFGGRIAYCAQSAWILNTTVRENIIFGREFDETRYWNCIRAACLLTDLDQLPAGDMTEIGEKGITLSGGQRQRVSIARTLYYDADVVLLDDPLSAVDAHVGNHIFQHAIQGMLKDKTVILVTHALQYLAHADNVIVMENGRIAEEGSFDALLNSNSAFSRFAHEYGVVNAVAQTDEKAQQDEVDEVMDEETETEKSKTEEINPEMAAGKTYGSSRPLVQKEEQATGSIKLSTWYTFAKAANGLFTVPAVLLSLTLMSASQILSQFALTWWQNNNWGLGSNTYIGVYAALGISSALFTFLLGLATVWFGTAAARTLHNMAMKQVIQAPMTYFDQTPLGRIMNRFSKDTDNLDSRLNDSLRMALATVAQIAAAVIMISIVYPYFLIPVAAIAYLFVTTSNFYRPSARAIKRHDATLRSFLFAWFGESLTGLPTIRAFGEQERFLRGNEKYIDLENRAWFLTPINQRFLATLIDTLGALLVLVVAIVAVAERTTIPPSKTGLILSVTLAMQQAVTMLVRQTAEVENNMASIERFEFYAKKLPQEAALDLPSTAPPPEWPSQGRISMRNVELRYRPELPAVIRNFTLEIGAGEKVGVVGRTGAGKSTLTQAMFRIVELSEGTIEIDDIDIRTLGLTQLRERLSIIPQEPLLFNGTIRSNLDPFGLYDDARLWDALRRSWLVDRTSGTDNVAEASRFTLDTPIEDEGANLSVGERSLVSLARALVRDSKIVCLDEATASVDLETDARIQATIRSEFRDKTLLTIAHRIQTILGSDRILVMDRGEISAFAPPLELFDRHDGIFYSLCVQSNISRDDILKAQAF
ncbi:ABC transporter [Rhodotorula sp. JG-1b]|nr:ABC transporter [Rhodotorula sp. JG-1b]